MELHREAPSTDHDLLVRIWTILEGTNGSGLITRFGCVEKDVSEIKSLIPNLWTKDQHEQATAVTRAEHSLLKDRRKVTSREWFLGVGLLTIPLIVLIVEHFWK